MTSAIRSISNQLPRAVYLTFDDGPDPDSTARVLEILERHGARATFFVIAEKAEARPELLREILAAGHAIGNHSLDHGYSRFFRGKKALRDWVVSAEERVSRLTGAPTVGFRPPAGVRTPELHAVLRDLEIPLVLWSTRFYDTAFRWTERKALRSIAKARAGDIVILHDRQRPERLGEFLETLETYLVAGKEAGFEFHALGRDRMNEIMRRENHA